MRSYHVSSGDGIYGLLLRSHEPPIPGIGEVAVHAVSLGFCKLLVLRGQ